MSHTTSCLNCNENLIGKFCYNCGQKSDTHRITLKHFIFHDVLHGVWHIEKGIIFTIKESITRPGKAALDYISGKRIRYYNVFYLILILIGLNVILADIYEYLLKTYFPNKYELETTTTNNGSAELFNNYFKLLIFGIVPILAINSYMLFRRKKFNFSEHLIIAGIVLLGVMVFTTIGQLIDFFDAVLPFSTVDFTNTLIPFSLIIYLLISYNNVIKNEYSAIQRILYLLLFLLLLFLECYAIIKIIKYIYINS